MLRPLRLSWPLLAVLLTALVAAGPAAADYRDVLGECETGLTRQYSAADLKRAAQKMSAYQRDYTNCSDAIYQAQTSGKRGGQGGQGNQGNSRSGSAGGGTGTSDGSGGGAGGGAATGAPGASGSSPDGTTPGAASTLTPDEKYIATQAATQQADADGSLEQLLAAAKVPASALTYSSGGSAVPLPLVIALAASGALALLAVTMSLLARWRRGRVD